jgi:hypothetical protein
MDKQSATHIDAVERLNEARDEQRQCAEQHDAARGSSGELFAQAKLQAAGEQFAAREAWVQWTERDY